MTIDKDINHLANIGRAEDLPYFNSPPVQFTYQSTATLSLGSYVWADTPSSMSPVRPLIPNALYYFRNITLVADVEEFDFQAAVVTPPAFYTFLKGDANAVLFREPILMPTFLQQFDYRFFWMRSKSGNELFGGFRGAVVQSPALMGKGSIELTAIISAQEITDENFIKKFTNNHPDLNGRKK